MNQLLLDIVPEHRPTLDNFVVGRNAELLSALRQPPVQGVLYLWGEPGCGKSHLLRASVEQARAAGHAAHYAIGSVPGAAQTVAVDDVETLDAAGQVALFECYNRQRDNGGQLLVSGTRAPAFLDLRDDLRTRLGWGLVFQVHALDDAEKSEAIRQYAATRGFDLPAEVVQYLLRHGRRDLPSLLAILDALDEQCLRLRRAASVPLLKDVLQQISRLK